MVRKGAQEVVRGAHVSGQGVLAVLECKSFEGVTPRSVIAEGVAVAQGVSHETFDSSQASGHGTKVKPATLAGRRPRERASASGLFTPLTCEEERWSDG